MGVVKRSLRFGKKPLALRPADSHLIVMVCTDAQEAEEVSRQLTEFNNGCLVTYRRVQDLVASSPSGKVALIILATDDQPVVIAKALKWLRHHWPKCQLTVVGDAGGGQQEMVAREGGAFYLTRPITSEQWAAVLSHVLKRQGVPKKV